jgi:hypothetical protein
MGGSVRGVALYGRMASRKSSTLRRHAVGAKALVVSATRLLASRMNGRSSARKSGRTAAASRACRINSSMPAWICRRSFKRGPEPSNLLVMTFGSRLCQPPARAASHDAAVQASPSVRVVESFIDEAQLLLQWSTRTTFQRSSRVGKCRYSVPMRTPAEAAMASKEALRPSAANATRAVHAIKPKLPSAGHLPKLDQARQEMNRTFGNLLSSSTCSGASTSDVIVLLESQSGRVFHANSTNGNIPARKASYASPLHRRSIPTPYGTLANEDQSPLCV